MAMPHIRSARLGDLFLLIYDYAKAGDCLPMHNHSEENAHIIQIVLGRVMLRVTMLDGEIVNTIQDCGNIIDTEAGYPHEIISLEDNSRTVHITKKMIQER